MVFKNNSRKKKKKKNCKKGEEKVQEMICVPKCCQQRRSNGTRPRTDFSLFFNSSSSSQGSRFEFLSCKDNLSGITVASIDRHEEGPNFPLARCIKSTDGEKGRIRSNFIGTETFTEIDMSQETLVETCNNGNDLQVQTCNNGNDLQNKCNEAMASPCTPNTCTSQATTYSDVWTTPGSVIWAKTACQMWWPAQIMSGRSTPVSPNDEVKEHVLVQYYGNNEMAWINSAGDLSQFDECFEERSSNPMEAFQDALKQALQREKHPGLCKQLARNFDGVKNSNQQDESSGAEPIKCIESSSSRAEDDHTETRRGKRQRKPKARFDEASFPMKSTKKMRRYRIMRQLALTAPIGSPFSLPSRVRTASVI